jgi:fatty-acyl-CoA synthase
MIGNTMMDAPLTLLALLERAEELFGDQEIISWIPDPNDRSDRPRPLVHRYRYADACRRSRQLSSALANLGVQRGDRVATLATNHYRHLEAYLAVPCMGAVLHTVNVRLPPEQLIYIVRHGGAEVLLIDHLFARLIPPLLANCPALRAVLVMGGPQGLAASLGDKVFDYEAQVASGDPYFVYPQLAESEASGLCYTSGTTGMPKGVVYSHRSTILHALSAALPDTGNISRHDTLLPVVPMFHVNAWGVPHSGLLAGSRLVFASIYNDGASLARLMESERVTGGTGVPTIWMGLADALEEAIGAGHPYQLQLKSLLIGGSAVPEALIQRLDRLGIQAIQGWGMTETSPIGSISRLPPGIDLGSELGGHLRAKQGPPVPLIQARVVDASGADVPRDGVTMGRLLVRGPWVAERYYLSDSTDQVVQIGGQNWLDTGDIASIDGYGFIDIRDRAKDMIKSGGEWISSVFIENLLMDHPAVAEAAVIATPDHKWGERPAAVLVLRSGAAASEEDFRQHLMDRLDRFPKWWLPDRYIFVPELPHSSVGKVLKRALRERYGLTPPG